MHTPATPAAGAPHRAGREDGEATRRLIIEASGRLFARHGFANTTSKMICATARVNAAAVNYHFGGREGLYRLVLEEVHNRIVNLAFLKEISGSERPARDKLATLLDTLTRHALDPHTWHIRLWAREMIEPTPLFAELARTTGRFKLGLLRGIVRDVTGIPEQDPALSACVLSTMAPCMVLLCLNRDLAGTLMPDFNPSPEELAASVKTFIFAGLDAAARAWREPRADKGRPPLQ